MNERQPSLANRLYLEWDQLRHRRSVLEHASGWNLVDIRIDSLDQVLTAVGFDRPAARSTEAALRELVLRAAHDQLAARVVVQRLLPGLVALSRRRRTWDHPDDVFSDLLASVWIAIKSFRPTRNPACVSAALLSDADDHAFRRQWRRRHVHESPAPPWRLDVGEPVSSNDTDDAAVELELAIERAIRAGLLTERAADLRRFAGGSSTDQLAAELKISERAVRYRRRRATTAIQHALALPKLVEQPASDSFPPVPNPVRVRGVG